MDESDALRDLLIAFFELPSRLSATDEVDPGIYRQMGLARHGPIDHRDAV